MYIIKKPGKIDLLKIVKRKATAKNCLGCRDNFYNGNNHLGVQRCWLLDTARLVRRKQVHINDVPPWWRQPVLVIPDCFRQSGYVYVGKDQLC